MALEGFIEDSLVMIAICSLLPLIISSAAGLGVSLLQALTQIQEQTVSYLAKVVSLSVVLWFSGGWLGSRLIRFFEEMLAALMFLGRIS